MMPAGIAAFEQRSRRRSAIYAYEQRASAKLAPAEMKLFKANPVAWKFITEVAPWYRQKALYRITSARKPETRKRRLVHIIAISSKRQML
jgi:uncharacterized protein YdeI (YjbR/CyaY-like superfamily)